MLLLGPLDMTFSTESVPLFASGPPWSIQLSASAVSVACDIVHGGGASTVHVCDVIVAGTTGAAIASRTRNVCSPGVRSAYAFGESHATNGAPSSEHSNVVPGSSAVKLNDASRDCVVGGRRVADRHGRRDVADRPSCARPATDRRCRPRPWRARGARARRRRGRCTPSATRRRVNAGRVVEAALERDAGLVGGELERRRRALGRVVRARRRSSCRAASRPSTRGAPAWRRGCPPRRSRAPRSACAPTPRPGTPAGSCRPRTRRRRALHSNVELGLARPTSTLAVEAERDGARDVVIVVSGAAVSTVQRVASPASRRRCRRRRSRGRAACARRAASPPKVTTWLSGDSHSANAAPSSEHSNVTPVSFDAKRERGAASSAVTPAGRRRSSSRAPASTVQSYSAGVSSATPCALTRAHRERVVAVRRGRVLACGDAQAANAPPSSAHSNVEPGLVGRERERRARARGLGLGPAVDRRLGPRHDASTRARRASASRCRRRRPRAPRTRGRRAPGRCTGPPSRTASNAAPSSEHSNVASGSSAREREVRESLPVTAGGPNVIVVSGRRVVGDRPRVRRRHRLDDRVGAVRPGPGTCAPRSGRPL